MAMMKCKHCGGAHKSEDHAKMGRKAEEHKAGEKGARAEMHKRMERKAEDKKEERKMRPREEKRGSMEGARRMNAEPRARTGGDLKTAPVAMREGMAKRNAVPVVGSPGHPPAPGGSVKVVHEHHHYHHRAGSHTMTPPMKGKGMKAEMK